MNAKYTHMTLTEHIETGNRLKAAKSVIFKILSTHPKTSRPAQQARRLDRVLCALSSTLDDEVCQLVPSRKDPHHLATRVYYGNPMVPSKELHLSDDSFAGWKLEGGR